MSEDDWRELARLAGNAAQIPIATFRGWKAGLLEVQREAEQVANEMRERYAPSRTRESL